jgi:hypothetical protein
LSEKKPYLKDLIIMCLKGLLFVVICSIVMPKMLTGQISDSDSFNNNDFEKTFENEFKKQDKNPKQKPIILGVGSELLPQWFFNPPSSTDQMIYAVGIADPALPDNYARLQATERALSLISLMSGTNVTALSDNYQGTKGTKFEEINRFKGAYPLLGKYAIVDSFTTRFKEKLVLIKYEKNHTDSLPFRSEFELYKSQLDAGAGTYYTSNIIAKCKHDTNSLYYNYKQYVNDFLIISIVNNQPIDIPLAIYAYAETSKSATDSAENKIAKLAHRGLWQGYLESFMESLSFLSSNTKSSSKSLGQIEQQAVTGNIARDISNNKIFFSINKISIFDNKLNVLLVKRN